jgi:hypothetical protein
MLKKLILSGLTALMLIGLSNNVYSQMGVAMYASNVEVSPNADMYAPVYVWSLHSDYAVNSTYAKLPGPADDPYYKYEHVHDMYVEDTEDAGPTRAHAYQITNETNKPFVTYRNYVRPSDREDEQVNYLEPMVPVVTTSVATSTSIGVAPHGFNYYSGKKINTPIRDFRADFWLKKYYRDEVHNHASYYKEYEYTNFYNEGAGEDKQ